MGNQFLSHKLTLHLQHENKTGNDTTLPVPVAARLLGLRGRFPPGAWMSVCCVSCVVR
jgi:hypothetical protein